MGDNPQMQKLEMCVFMDSVHAVSQRRDQDQGPGTEPGTGRAKKNTVLFDNQQMWGVYCTARVLVVVQYDSCPPLTHAA